MDDRNLMGRAKFAPVAILLLAKFCGLAVLSGCGASDGTVSVTPSPEAKAAEQGLQGGMKEFMQSKVKVKPKSGKK